MFRQGCVRAKFDNAYTLNYPAASTGLGGLTLETTTATAGMESQFRSRASERLSHNDLRMLNPCIINGISCTVTYSSVKPLEPCTDVAGDWISAHGAVVSPSSDVNVYYIGRNGGYQNTAQLVAQNQAMADFGSIQYIVLGFHEPTSKLKSIRNVDETYVSKMESAFGSHFLNLNKEIRLRAAELTYLVGIYDVRYGFYLNDEDWEYYVNGDIPKSLYISDLYHPNEYGCKAFAILIHDKMVKLGYLDDYYILSTGSDL